MSALYLDIESAPMVDPTREDLSAPASYKKPESIEKYIDDHYDELMEKEVKKRSLSMYDSKIICVGYAFNNEPTQAIIGKEDQILKILGSHIKKYTDDNGGSPEGITIIGHNIKKFDAPLLYLKACKYKANVVKNIFFFGRRNIVDTMELGVFFKYGEFVSMDRLCKFFGIEGKGDMDGSMVYHAYKEGRIEEIAKYCRDDVHKTRKLEKLLRP